ncbi:MAG TPA: hypothetical protein VHE81_20180 [Lacipirellulaceae bacterium]|nr:hypothetical protein [Lacipirellulaceae bacterium]
MKRNSEEFILHFGTRPHELDASTLVTSLGAMQSVLRELNAASQNGAVLRLKVKTFRPGSFEVPVEIQQMAIAGTMVLAAMDWSTVRQVVGTMTDLIKLTIALKGRSPKKAEIVDDRVEIPRKGQSPITVDRRTYNFYNSNVVINEGLAKGFQALSDDKQVRRFKLLDSKRHELVDVPRKAFKTIAERSVKKKTEKKSPKTERTELRVFKVVFEGEAPKWDFYYNGIKITASLLDSEFMDRVTNRGERFGRGDCLDVDLEIVREFDPSIQTHVNRAYNVRKVYRHRPRAQQKEFDFGDGAGD